MLKKQQQKKPTVLDCFHNLGKFVFISSFLVAKYKYFFQFHNISKFIPTSFLSFSSREINYILQISKEIEVK